MSPQYNTTFYMHSYLVAEFNPVYGHEYPFITFSNYEVKYGGQNPESFFGDKLCSKADLKKYKYELKLWLIITLWKSLPLKG